MLLQDVIQQLKQENKSLQQQLQQQQHGAAAGPDQHSSNISTPQANGTAGPNTTLNNSNSSSSRGPSSKGGILELNVSGTALTTSLAALQQVRGAFLGGGLDVGTSVNTVAQQLYSPTAAEPIGRD